MEPEKYHWKIWLVPNRLTQDVSNDYLAEVSTILNTKTNADVSRRIVTQRTEFRFGTILSLLDLATEIRLGMLQEGMSVTDNLIHITPRITGLWIGATSKFDPEVHRMTLDLVETKQTRDTLALVGVEVLGAKETTATIGLATNTTSRINDNRYDPGDDIVIDGEKIKIWPDDDGELGVFFIEEDGTEHTPNIYPSLNQPKRVITRIPAITKTPDDKPLRLVIRTKYTTGNQLLKNMREIEYKDPIMLKGTTI